MEAHPTLAKWRAAGGAALSRSEIAEFLRVPEVLTTPPMSRLFKPRWRSLYGANVLRWSAFCGKPRPTSRQFCASDGPRPDQPSVLLRPDDRAGGGRGLRGGNHEVATRPTWHPCVRER